MGSISEKEVNPGDAHSPMLAASITAHILQTGMSRHTLICFIVYIVTSIDLSAYFEKFSIWTWVGLIEYYSYVIQIDPVGKDLCVFLTN